MLRNHTGGGLLSQRPAYFRGKNCPSNVFPKGGSPRITSKLGCANRHYYVCVSHPAVSTGKKSFLAQIVGESRLMFLGIFEQYET